MKSKLSENIWLQVGVHQRFVLPLLIFTIAIDATRSILAKILMNETLNTDFDEQKHAEFERKLVKWKEPFDSKEVLFYFRNT